MIFNAIVTEKGKIVKGEVGTLYYFRQHRIKINGAEHIFTVTDDGERARKLRDAGQPVAVYIHPGNRGEDFSDFRYVVEEPEDLDPEYMEKVCRRLLGLPWDILKTRRCLIRETTVDDVERFYEIYKDPAITEYMEDLYPEKEKEREYIRQYIDQVYGFWEFGVWTVAERESGAVIGRAGFSFREGFEEPELGFIIGVPWQRRGYGEEVCRGILRYGEEVLRFETIQALVEPQNAASLRLCRKLGFYDTGIVKADGRDYRRLLRNRGGEKLF